MMYPPTQINPKLAKPAIIPPTIAPVGVDVELLFWGAIEGAEAPGCAVGFSVHFPLMNWGVSSCPVKNVWEKV